jgi:DNA-binding MarR family transcriptional regulator
MENLIIDRVVEDLYSFLPVIHRKLKGSINKGLDLELTHYHLAILGMLSKSKVLSISEIGKRLIVSKPQMTAIIDRLINMRLVLRNSDIADRRIINISITKAGEKALVKTQVQIKKNIKKKMANLNEQDLELLAKSIDNLKMVTSKME